MIKMDIIRLDITKMIKVQGVIADNHKLTSDTNNNI